MICTKCGSTIKDGKVYCSSCGEPVQIVKDYNLVEEELLTAILNDDEDDDKIDRLMEEALAEPDEYEPAVTTQLSPAEKQKKILVIICISVTFLIMIVGICTGIYVNSYSYYLHSGKKDLIAMDYDGAKFNLLKCVSKQPNRKEAYKYLTFAYSDSLDYQGVDALLLSAPTDDIRDYILSNIIPQVGFSMDEGQYNDDIEVLLSAPEGFNIYYTLSTIDPREEGMLYDNMTAFAMSEGTYVIKAACQNDKGEWGPTIKRTYNIEYEAPDTPAVNPSSGAFYEPTKIEITVPEGCRVYYSWDSNDSIEQYKLYVLPIPVIEGNNLLNVYVKDKHGLVSDVLQCNYKYYQND